MILVAAAVGAVFLALASLVALWQLIAPTPVPLARRVEALHEPPAAVPARFRARWQHWALRLLGSTMGERAVLEMTFPYTGDYMFHAHQSEFAELGWMSFFRVVEEEVSFGDAPALAAVCDLPPAGGS